MYPSEELTVADEGYSRDSMDTRWFAQRRAILGEDVYGIPNVSRTYNDFLTACLRPERWMAEGRCVDSAIPEAWFPINGRATIATQICAACPVRKRCADYAQECEENGQRLEGIWGGTTPEQRRANRKKKETAA